MNYKINRTRLFITTQILMISIYLIIILYKNLWRTSSDSFVLIFFFAAAVYFSNKQFITSKLSGNLLYTKEKEDISFTFDSLFPMIKNNIAIIVSLIFFTALIPRLTKNTFANWWFSLMVLISSWFCEYSYDGVYEKGLLHEGKLLRWRHFEFYVIGETSLFFLEKTYEEPPSFKAHTIDFDKGYTTHIRMCLRDSIKTKTLSEIDAASLENYKIYFK